MKKTQKVSIPLPEQKRMVVFEADLTDKDEQEFKTRLEAAAAVKPKNLQELIIALVNQEEHSKFQ